MHRFFTTLALAIAVASAIEKPTLEAYVRHLFVWGPHIKVDRRPQARPCPAL
jgi:hypothetical protein